MMRILTKKELADMVLSEVVNGPQWKVSNSNVYELHEHWMTWTAEQAEQIAKVHTISELECAINNPKIKEVFLPEDAKITRNSLTQLLQKAPVAKNVYAAC